jgi:ABC-type multidrug transport system ATPase subunit
MRPAGLVLDEATSMLDPAGRRAVHEAVRELHRQGMAIVTITQDMAEAAVAERVIVLSAGQVVREGPPRAVLTDESLLQDLGLDLPPMARLSQMLHTRHPQFPADLLTPAEVVTALQAQARGGAR